MTFKYNDSELDLEITVRYKPESIGVEPPEHLEPVYRKLVGLLGSTGIYFTSTEQEAEWLVEQLDGTILERDTPPNSTDESLVY